MKYSRILFLLVPVITILSCATTQVAEKPAYINNEIVRLPNEKASNITIVSVSMKDDKSVYEKIAQDIQAYLNKKNIPSDMLFFDATQPVNEVNARIHQSTKTYYLILEKMNTSYQKDEMNNDFIVKQMPCSLQKSTGERIADINIGIDRYSGSNKMAGTIASLITGYLSKKNLL